MRMQWIIAPALAGLVCASATPAAAQGATAEAKAAADQLFRQGRALAKKGDWEAACPKFAASLKYDPALGTQLNLAICYERTGRLASAYGLYREASELADKAGERKRARAARTSADKLVPRLPKLIIRVRDADSIDGLSVARDGLPVDAALFGEPIYVDPGARKIEASAPGYAPFATTATAVEGERVEVEIALERAGRAAGGETRRGAGETSGDGGATTGRGAEGLGDDVGGPGESGAGDGGDPGRSRRLIGLATGGAGVAVLATGLGFGLSAISTYNGAFDSGQCDRDTLLCTEEGQAQTNTARGRATLSNVMVGVGVAAVGAGVVLYLTAPKRTERARAARGTRGGATESAEAAARVVPAIGPDRVGVSVVGRF